MPEPLPFSSLEALKSGFAMLGDPELAAKRAKAFRITAGNMLGISMKEIKAFAKPIGTHHAWALELYKSSVHEHRLLAALMADPKQFDWETLNQWVEAFDSWDLCDTVSTQIIVLQPDYRSHLVGWAIQEAEFIRRTPFATIAGAAHRYKSQPDPYFQTFFPLIETYAYDERNFVKKAVSWALRGIGKRNPNLRDSAIALAGRIKNQNSKGARWVAHDVLRELQNPDLKLRNYPREVWKPR
ncbi:DNA alkylation repair protein [Pontibacter sp. G13]|uniref:DNA alkylation repair protein n=1 Tax=Pontibacter sp. G13 TaxID=3074898 RepID=UPI00288BC2BA|nr:DNA alkylation repair protein [Pontibacter sp. G13]WNJ18648.1 DNA alkylation repair protein [Pontibacter sp. G13]